MSDAALAELAELVALAALAAYERGELEVFSQEELEQCQSAQETSPHFRNTKALAARSSA